MKTRRGSEKGKEPEARARARYEITGEERPEIGDESAAESSAAPRVDSGTGAARYFSELGNGVC